MLAILVALVRSTALPIGAQLSLEALHRDGKLQARGTILEHSQRLAVLFESLVVSRGIGVLGKHEAARERLSGLLSVQRAAGGRVHDGFRVDKEAFVPSCRATLEQNTVLELASLGLLFFVESLDCCASILTRATETASEVSRRIYLKLLLDLLVQLRVWLVELPTVDLLTAEVVADLIEKGLSSPDFCRLLVLQLLG